MGEHWNQIFEIDARLPCVNFLIAHGGIDLYGNRLSPNPDTSRFLNYRFFPPSPPSRNCFERVIRNSFDKPSWKNTSLRFEVFNFLRWNGRRIYGCNKTIIHGWDYKFGYNLNFKSRILLFSREGSSVERKWKFNF